LKRFRIFRDILAPHFCAKARHLNCTNSKQGRRRQLLFNRNP
jgi:hypothetical protein